MYQLLKFSPHLNSITLLGVTLLLGLIGGEIAKRIYFLPQIFGYIFVGFLIGSGGFNLINQSALISTRIFIDISLSLILFELGRHLDFIWLRHDPSILLMSIMESALTFVLIYGVLHYVAGMSLMQSSLASTIAIATSPAVVMMIAYDLSAEGPVSRRALILTGLNNLYALILFVILMPLTKSDETMKVMLSTLFRLGGSALLGVIMFVIALLIAKLIGKNKENQFVLYVGIVLSSLGLTHLFNLSSMFSLFILGVAARNFDTKHILMEINFGWLARLFFVLLFVVTGIHLRLQGFLSEVWIVLAFVLLRMLAKIIGIWSCASISRLTSRQSFALGFALFPMAGVAIGMSNVLVDFNPAFGNKLLVIITAAVAVLNIIGPISTQLAFVMTGESLLLNYREQSA